jgi:hypothetical protein
VTVNDEAFTTSPCTDITTQVNKKVLNLIPPTTLPPCTQRISTIISTHLCSMWGRKAAQEGKGDARGLLAKVI